MKTWVYEGNMRQIMTWATNRGDRGLETSQMSSKYDKSVPPQEYLDFVKNLLPENCRNYLMYWVGTLDDTSQIEGEEWEIGYPHIHTQSIGWPPDTTTVLTYFAVPESGGEFAMGGLSSDDPYELIKPFPRLTIVVDAKTWHGIKKIHKGTRIVLMTTGVPT